MPHAVQGLGAKQRGAEELNLTQPTLSRQLAELEEELNIVGTYNLVFNARFMAEQGFGSVLSFSGLLSTDAGDEVGLVFRPLTPELRSRNYLIWKTGQVFPARVVWSWRASTPHYRTTHHAFQA